ncbi:MAG: TonB-dependent receptor [Alistipes sp.]|nr:TonB-dependent receptor [Alistipes senegalensis]MCM1251128.1 TonB-dependent receptor [Alistipes sp.]
MPKSLFRLFFLLFAGSAAAQTFDDEYYPFASYEEPRPMLEPDSTLFYRAVQSAPDLFGSVVRFVSPQVAASRRGQTFDAEVAAVDGTEVSYRLFSALRSLGAEETAVPGVAMLAGRVGGAGGQRTFEFPEGLPLSPYRASVSFSGRNYLVGAKFSAVGESSRGWRYAAAAEVRTGRDLYVAGVFTQALTAALRIEKSLGDSHRLALLLIVPLSMRGTRLSSTEESFSLTGDRLYNPAWGFQNGKVRNSRVRREAVPWAVVSWRSALSASTSLLAAVSAEAGVRKYGSLNWYDARTPMPDNYRYMPSFTLDRESEQAWRAADPRYTQVDWDALIAVNRLAGGPAVYTLEDRVAQICNLRLDAAFTTRIDPRLTFDYGFFFGREATRNYKRMRDLLGAGHVVDIDQYLVDDATYGNSSENDLRHPGRRVGEGDRFAYDYSLVRLRTGARLSLSYRADRFRFDAAAELGEVAVFRRGYMEKELFPGARSYGRSRRIRSAAYAFKALAGWAFSPRSYVEVAAAACAAVPDSEQLFFQPLYNNLIVGECGPGHLYAAELNFRRTGSFADLQASAFIAASFDGLATRRYFDDLSGLYCDVSVSGIASLACGFEAAASLRLSSRWRLSLSASAGRYKYIRDPHVTVISDSDNAAVDTRADSYMGSCSVGGVPQLTASAEASYFGPRGWGFRLSAGYAGVRYVEPAYVRRTARIARQGGTTPEAFDAFMRQERLPDAFTADASVFKSFYVGHSRLVASLLVRNLPGSRTTVYNGYESMRVQRITAGDTVAWRPHATRYTYAYPRSFYLSVSYSF